MKLEIPESELRWRFDTSGGPGGQHANRSNTRVELTFDIEHSRVFDESTRRRVIDKLGTEIRISEDGSRSQSTNRTRAVHRLKTKLESASRPEAPARRKTRPARSARARRLNDKRARGATKKTRRSPGPDE